MAVLSPAIGIQSGSHSAKAFRQLAAALAGSEVETFVNSVSKVDVGHGLVRSTHLAVTQNGTPNMSVNVAKGSALVNGSSTLAQAVYAVTNDATVNLVIATADATNPRRDLVVLQVRDNTEDAGGSNDARLFVVTGTPAASPTDPAIPAGSLVLARVAVAALASTIVNANITALAGLARGSNWNLEWGVVPGGRVQRTTTQTTITTAIDVTSMTRTWTAIPGRLYRIEFSCDVVSTVADDYVVVDVVNGTTPGGTTVTRAAAVTRLANQGVTIGRPVTLAGLSGTQTHRLVARRQAGTGSVSVEGTSTYPMELVIYDVGPA